MNTQIVRPTKTFHNQQDGHTYWLAAADKAGREGSSNLWACPTLADGTPEFSSALLADEFDAPLSKEERRRIIAALTEVREIIWKDEGRDSEGQSFGPAYAEDEAGNLVLNYGWVTWKKADEFAKALGVELVEV